MSQARERIVAIVQARLASSRLPGKVLLPLAGRPALLHVVDRLRRVEDLDGVLVAIPGDADERPLAEFLFRESVDVHVWGGDSSDLLGRYLAVARAEGADGILMVDGDCPLLDPDTASRMVAALRAEPDAEYVRIAPPSIEGGVACLRTRTFERIDREGASGPEREHATLRVMNRPEDFRIVDIAPDPAFADPRDEHRFWLDTPADHAFLQALFSRLHRPEAPIDLRDVVKLLRDEPELRRLNGHVAQRDPQQPGRLVALLPPRGERERAFFCELGTRLAERHQLGVRTLFGPAAADEARRAGADCIVIARGDPRRKKGPLPVVETDPLGEIDNVAAELCVRLAQTWE